MIMPEPKLAPVRQVCAGARHQSATWILSCASHATLARVPQREGVAQVAGRILIAWQKRTQRESRAGPGTCPPPRLPDWISPARSKWNDWKLCPARWNRSKRSGWSKTAARRARRRRAASGTSGAGQPRQIVPLNQRMKSSTWKARRSPVLTICPLKLDTAVERAYRPAFHRMVQPHHLSLLRAAGDPLTAFAPRPATPDRDLAAHQHLQSGFHVGRFRLFAMRWIFVLGQHGREQFRRRQQRELPGLLSQPSSRNAPRKPARWAQECAPAPDRTPA